MNDNTRIKAPQEAFVKTRDYFLGNSLKPAENVPDLLAENRKIAVSLAESVMSLMDVIANYSNNGAYHGSPSGDFPPTWDGRHPGASGSKDVPGPQRLCPVGRYLQGLIRLPSSHAALRGAGDPTAGTVCQVLAP